MRVDWHKFISVDPEVHHGEPCIKGTRIPVSMIVGSVADGMTFDEIIDSYPQLKKEAIQAALEYANDETLTSKEMGSEYLFDYKEAKPNRFAQKMTKGG
jgi:uncharacterized protein (DUF433 family)